MNQLQFRSRAQVRWMELSSSVEPFLPGEVSALSTASLECCWWSQPLSQRPRTVWRKKSQPQRKALEMKTPQELLLLPLHPLPLINELVLEKINIPLPLVCTIILQLHFFILKVAKRHKKRGQQIDSNRVRHKIVQAKNGYQR